MEIPAKVSVFNRTLDLKGKAASLIAVSPDGYYEINMEVNQRIHTVLFPISDTVIILNDPVPQISADFEVER